MLGRLSKETGEYMEMLMKIERGWWGQRERERESEGFWES